MYSYISNKFEAGDKVMYAGDFYGNETIYTVTNPYTQTRDRIVITDPEGFTMRVSQNQVRKLSRAELSVCNAYRKLIEDVKAKR